MKCRGRLARFTLGSWASRFEARDGLRWRGLAQWGWCWAEHHQPQGVSRCCSTSCNSYEFQQRPLAMRRQGLHDIARVLQTQHIAVAGVGHDPRRRAS